MFHHQRDDYSCGPASIQNALATYGVSKSQHGLAALAGTDCELGTSEDGIKRALLAYGHTIDEFQSDSRSEALQFLNTSLAASRPVILCVDRWEHWICVVGSLGKKFYLMDPTSKESYLLAGLSLTQSDKLLKRWQAGKRTRKRLPRFYAIAVGPSYH